MNPRWFRRGSTGWAFVLGGVLAWDLLAPDEHCLTDSFRKANRNPVTAAVVGVSWGLLTAHLYNLLPQQVDPLHTIHVARHRSWRRRRVLAS